MYQKSKIIILTLYILLIPCHVYPQLSYDTLDLFSLSLEELLNLEVTSASKKSEEIFDAPSVITSISSNEISDFGARNIYEVLERSASFYGLSSYFFPSNVVGLRGNLPTHVNPNILFLVNGRPFRESILGGQQVALLTSFPLHIINKIEIIRGPGSVLYGTSAYIGVVNIITKKKGDSEPIVVDVSGGSLSSVKVDASWLGSIKNLNINSGINFYKTKGWEFSDSLFFAGQARFGENNFGQNAISGFLNLDFKNFSLNTFHGKNMLGKVHNTGEAADYKASRSFVDLGYSDTITNWYSLKANITYNNINDIFWENATNGLAYELKSNDLIYELTNYFSPTDNLNFILGGSVSVLKGEQFFGDEHTVGGEVVEYPIEPYTTIWYNSYLQADYKPTSWLKLIVGAQANKIPSTNIDLTPRIAAIVRSNNGLGVKLMYGRAFRAPSLSENEVNVIGVRGNENVTPEKIGTFESQLFYSKEAGSVSLTYFNSKQTDIISRAPNTDTTISNNSIYVNSGRHNTWGLELEGKVIIDHRLFITGSYSYQINKNNDGIENQSLLPNSMFKLGVSYLYRDSFTFSVFNQYYSSPHNFSEINDLDDRNRQGEGSLSSINWLTAKLKLNMNTLLKINKGPKIQFTTEVVNALNQTVYNPEIVFNGFDAIQTKPNRTFYVGMQLNF